MFADLSAERLRSIAVLCLLLGACGIALAPIFVRLSELPPIATAFYRLALAAPVLLLVMTWQPPATTLPAKGGVRWVVLAGLAFAGDLGFWHLSIVYTSVANATLFANFAPVFVTVAAWLWLGERVRPLFLVGLIMGIGGATLLLRASRDLGGTHVLGDIYGLITALFYAVYLIAIKLARRHFGTLRVMAGSTVVGALALLPFAWGMEGVVVAQTLSGWLVLIALALVAHIGGQGLIAYAMAHLPASFSSVTLLLQPAVAAGLAWWLFNEVLGPVQIIGAATILLAVLIVQYSGSRQVTGTVPADADTFTNRRH